MKIALWTALTAVVCSSATALSISDLKTTGAGGFAVVPGNFIVEYEDSGSSLNKRQQANADDTLRRLQNNRTIRASPRKTFKNRLFSGASIKVAENITAAEIQSFPGVKRVWPVRKITLPKPTTPGDLGTNKPQAVTAAELQDGSPALTRRASALHRRQTPVKDTWSPHIMTQVDKLREQGNRGAGVRIGVLDTGVDYLNPILGGCFGDGCQIKFGYSFVADDYVVGGAQTESPDPYTDCSEHGTHVTGIVGALENRFGFSGVAPDADIGHYRVFACSGETGDDVIISAMLKAAEDNVDIISMSLGGAVGWLDASPLQVLVNRLTAQGIVVVSSAGNDRTEGAFWASSPAASKLGISVASVDVESLPSYDASVTGQGTVPILTALPFDGAPSLRLVVASPTNACGALASADYTNTVVLIERGVCTFYDKMVNAARAGAKYALIYNSATGSAMPYLDVSDTGLTAVGAMRREDGLQLLAWYNANPTSTTVTFTSTASTNTLNTQSGSTISAFSSFGPTNDMFGAPTISGPGGSILSTVPLSFGGLGVLSGTSMSCPLVSGAIALLLSARSSENLTPEQVRLLLSMTGKKTAADRGGSELESVVLQGGGMIQIADAVAARTLISPHELTMNDTQFRKRSHTLTLTNNNPYTVTYTLSSSTAQGLGVYNNAGDILPSTQPPVIAAAVSPRVTFSGVPRVLSLNPGTTRSITVNIDAPTLSAADAGRFPIFSGWIGIRQTASGKPTQDYTVPYFGLAANMFNAPVLDNTSTYAEAFGDGLKFPFLSSPAGVAQTTDAAKIYTISSGGMLIVSRLAQGTRLFTMDLVPYNYKLESTVAARSDEMTLSRRGHSMQPHQHDRRALGQSGPLASSIPTIGRIFSRMDAERDYAVSDAENGFTVTAVRWDGRVTNMNNATVSVVDTRRPYRLLVRALRITGDRTYQSSYDSWLSPQFRIQS